MTTTSAPAIAALLRRHGFNPVAPADHNREGLKVRQSATGRVRVTADLDSKSAANRMADDAHATLARNGYDVSDIDRDSAAFYVTATPVEADARAMTAPAPTYGCVQHIERGPECGPDCDEMTRAWNAQAVEAPAPATVSVEVDDQCANCGLPLSDHDRHERAFCETAHRQHLAQMAATQLAPYVGQPATINLWSDAQAAVVVKTSPKSILVQRVAIDEDNGRRINDPNEPLPCWAYEGMVDVPLQHCKPERYTWRNNAYRNGSISVTLGRSVTVRDYRH